MDPPKSQTFRLIKVIRYDRGQDVHGVPTQEISRGTRGVAFAVRSADVSF
jgi:hypothetical protein